MASFELPPINDNPDGGWGPSLSNFPQDFKFKDIPYTPFSKADKLGRVADWNDVTGDNRQGPSGNAGGRNIAGRRREGPQTFGAGVANAFAHFHVEDEASFSLVDNKTGGQRRTGVAGFGRGRGGGRGLNAVARGGQRGGRGGTFSSSRGGMQRGGRRGFRDWDKVSRLRSCIVSENSDYALSEHSYSRIVSRNLFRMAIAGGDRISSIGQITP